MKQKSIMFLAVYIIFFACTHSSFNPILANMDSSPAIGEFADKISLNTDRNRYLPGDTITVTLFNKSDSSIFLEGCNQLYLATKTDSGWIEKSLIDCVWEGFAVEVKTNQLFAQNFPASFFVGTHKFFAPIHIGCEANQPISQGDCTGFEKVYSQEFTVTGGNAKKQSNF